MLAAILCIAEAIYFEARNQSIDGQYAVAHVVLNRTNHPDFPDNPCDVIRQGEYLGTHPIRNRCQFSYYCDGLKETIRDPEAWGNAVIEAAAVYAGIIPDMTKGAIYYHSTSVSPNWAKSFTIVAKIDEHIFYR